MNKILIENIVLFSSVGILLLITITLILRIIVLRKRRRKISNLVHSAIGNNKDILNLISPLFTQYNYPPLLYFTINKETATNILNKHKDKIIILEEKLFKSYKYYFVFPPCVFSYKSKTEEYYNTRIQVKSKRALILYFKRLSQENPMIDF